MTEPHDGCMQRAGRQITASGKTAGVSLYLMEELGDARLHCAQLSHYIDLARQIVETSKAKDHIYEVAGHLLQAIPEHLFKLEKSLQAVALAADRMDYEEIKQDLKPDKVQELERVLKDVRFRTIPHRSEPGVPMNPTQAAEDLKKIAAEIRATGKIPVDSMAALVTALEGQEKTASEVTATADMLEEMGKALLQPTSEAPKRLQLAATLRKILADNVTAMGLSVSPEEQEARRSRFEKGEPANPMENMDPEDKEKWKQKNEEHGDNFKQADSEGAVLNLLRGVVNTLKVTPAWQFDPSHLHVIRRYTEKVIPDLLDSIERNWKEASGNPKEASAWKVSIDRSPAQFIGFLERMVGGVEEAAKQMRHSLNVYKQDTGKNAPQLGNFFREVASLQGQMRVLERAMPKDIVFASDNWKK
jgi:hypothetical protein